MFKSVVISEAAVPVGVLAKKTPAEPEDDLYSASVFSQSLKWTSPFAVEKKNKTLTVKWTTH